MSDAHAHAAAGRRRRRTRPPRRRPTPRGHPPPPALRRRPRARLPDPHPGPRAACSTAAEMRRAAGWFPLVGVVVGALAGGVRAATEPLLGGATATVLALAALVIVTGALHQDGLADCADGLGVRGDRATPARGHARLADRHLRDARAARLGAARLHDPRAAQRRARARRRLIAAAALGRAAALVHASTITPPARRDGLGAGFAVPRASLAAGLVTALVATAIATRDPGDDGDSRSPPPRSRPSPPPPPPAPRDRRPHRRHARRDRRRSPSWR